MKTDDSSNSFTKKDWFAFILTIVFAFLMFVLGIIVPIVIMVMSCFGYFN